MKGEGRADVLMGLRDLMVKQGRGRGYRRRKSVPPHPLPTPRDPVPPQRPVMAVEVDVGVSDPVGQWSLDPPEEGVQALHFVPRVLGVIGSQRAGPGLANAEIAVYGLSLIHISEPTRPY